MKVAAGDTLSLHFALRARGGAEVDSSFDDVPITFTLGDGTLIPSLEHWLIGLAPGERHVFLLDAAQAFGEPDPALIQTLPLRDFSASAPPAIDSIIEFSLPNGTTLAGRVLALSDADATVDFNHLLAGLPIEFEVEIVSIMPSAV